MGIKDDFPGVARVLSACYPNGVESLMNLTPVEVLSTMERMQEILEVFQHRDQNSGGRCGFDSGRVCNDGIDGAGKKCQAWQDSVDFGVTKMDGYCMRIGMKKTVENSRAVQNMDEIASDCLSRLAEIAEMRRSGKID
jgi:hypothetical protein